MRTITFRGYIFSLFFLMIFASQSSHAELINFDDIKRVTDPYEPFWADQPITDHYLGKGLLIDDGYLNEYYENDPSGPNFLQGGPYLSLQFIGKLPTFVSLVVTSSHDDMVFLDAACGDGSLLYAETPGWAGPDYNSPFKARNLITFTSNFGISQISISAFYFLRTSAMVDDIEFHYAVPEPHSVLLFSLAFLLLLSRRLGLVGR